MASAPHSLKTPRLPATRGPPCHPALRYRLRGRPGGECRSAPRATRCALLSLLRDGPVALASLAIRRSRNRLEGRPGHPQPAPCADMEVCMLLEFGGYTFGPGV